MSIFNLGLTYFMMDGQYRKEGRPQRPPFIHVALGSRVAASDVVNVSKKKLCEAGIIDMLALLRLNGVLQRSQRIFSRFASRRLRWRSAILANKLRVMPWLSIQPFSSPAVTISSR